MRNRAVFPGIHTPYDYYYLFFFKWLKQRLWLPVLR
jgi:hypothetical protein